MSDINNQYDFFKNVNLDADGNLGVVVSGGTGGATYWEQPAGSGSNAIRQIGSLGNPTGVNSLAGGFFATASGPFSTCFGVQSTTSGQGAFVGGASQSTAGGANNAIIGGSSNTTSGTNAVIVGSSSSEVDASQSVIVGGTNNDVPATMTNTVILGGQNIVAAATDTAYVSNLVVKTSVTPSSTSDTAGEVGSISYDATYMYVKTSAGWGRVALDYSF
jgi:hypothetical protein